MQTRLSYSHFKMTALKTTLTFLTLFLTFYASYAQPYAYTWKLSGKGDWANSKNWTSKPAGGTFPGDNGSVSDTAYINQGTAVINAGSYSISQMTMYAYGTGSANLTIAAGATLNVVGGSTSVAGLQLYPAATALDTIINNGTLSFTGSFSSAITLGGKSGANQVFTNTGSLQINAACSGAAFNYGSTGVNYTINNSGTMNITNTGALQTTLSSNNGNAVFTNSGSINLSSAGRVAFGGATGVFNNSGSFTTDMDFNCKGTFNNLTNGVLTFTGLSTASSYNAMQASVVFNNQGGTLNSAPGAKNAIGISGINTFTAGTISPGGSSIGAMTISAVAPVTSPMLLNNTIKIQVNGDKTAGTDYDKLSGTGGLSFNISGATLDVTGIFTPTKTKDTIVIIAPGGGTTTGTINGMFASVIGLTSGWSVYYASTGVKLVYNAALPVQLVSFSALEVNGVNLLTWQTATEINNKGFYIQRQTIDGAWVNLGFMAAKGSASSYNFQDDAPIASSNYRLLQVDASGTENYSKVVSVTNSNHFKMTIAPNPTTDKVHIVLPANNTGSGKVAIMVVDFNGKQVLSKQVANNSVDIDFSTLGKGTYLVKVVADSKVYSEKVVKQ